MFFVFNLYYYIIMKKLLVLAISIMAALTTITSASFYSIPSNDSSKVWTQPKLTWTQYMKKLKSVKLLNATWTKAILTTTLDKKGTVKNNYIKNTYTITVWYTSCKVANYINWRELPKTITVDLTNVKCLNKKQPVNFLPLLSKWQKFNVFFAKQNGITKNTVIEIK